MYEAVHGPSSSAERRTSKTGRRRAERHHWDRQKSKLEAQYKEVELVSTTLKNVCVYFASFTEQLSAYHLKKLVVAHSGTVTPFFSSKIVTHVVGTTMSAQKSADFVQKLKECPRPVFVVHPTWIIESVKCGKLLDENMFLVCRDESSTNISKFYIPQQNGDSSKLPSTITTPVTTITEATATATSTSTIGTLNRNSKTFLRSIAENLSSTLNTPPITTKTAPEAITTKTAPEAITTKTAPEAITTKTTPEVITTKTTPEATTTTTAITTKTTPEAITTKKTPDETTTSRETISTTSTNSSPSITLAAKNPQQNPKKYTPTQIKQYLKVFANHINPTSSTHLQQKSNKRKFAGITNSNSAQNNTNSSKENSSKENSAPGVKRPRIS